MLDVSFNFLKDLNGIQYSNLKNLKILKADHNDISKIELNDSLISLKEIDLNHNRIRQFDQ